MVESGAVMDTIAERAPVQISVVVPAYREQKRIGRCLQRLEGWLAEHEPDHEIIVVDDGSPDATSAVVKKWAGNHGRRRLIRYERNRGKGFAVRRGLAEACGRYVFFTDADLSTPPEEFDRALAALQHADIVVGTRAAAESTIIVHQRRYRESMGRVFNVLAGLLGVAWVADTQCGFKGFRREVLEPLLRESHIDGFAFDVELLLLARERGLRIHELPITWRNDPESHVHVFSDSLRMLADLVAIALRRRFGGR